MPNRLSLEPQPDGRRRVTIHSDGMPDLHVDVSRDLLVEQMDLADKAEAEAASAEPDAGGNVQPAEPDQPAEPEQVSGTKPLEQ